MVGERNCWQWARRCGWLVVAVAILGVGPAPRLNHSFDIPATGRFACTDGAVFDGTATGASALVTMTAEVWDGTGTNLLATGNSHTFTTPGETFTFTVPGSFMAGATVGLVVTNVPGSNAPTGGTEGETVTATVDTCSIATVPTLPVWGLALLSLALVAAGGFVLSSRSRRGRAAGPTATL